MHRKNALKVWGEESQAQQEKGTRANSTSFEVNHCSLAHENCCMSDRHICRELGALRYWSSRTLASDTKEERFTTTGRRTTNSVDPWPPNEGMSFASWASKEGMSPQLSLFSLDRRL